MKSTLFKAFKDGFIGSFVIAAIIVCAIPKAVNSYINQQTQMQKRN
jgi:hypothetical protein